MCPLVGCLVCRWRCELSLAGGAAPPSPLMRCIFPTPPLFWQAATPGHLRQAEGYASMGLSLHPATLPLAPALPASHDEPHQCTSVPATCSGAACNKSNQIPGVPPRCYGGPECGRGSHAWRHACRPHPRPLGGQQRPPAKSAAAASSLQRGQQRGSSPSGPPPWARCRFPAPGYTSRPSLAPHTTAFAPKLAPRAARLAPAGQHHPAAVPLWRPRRARPPHHPCPRWPDSTLSLPPVGPSFRSCPLWAPVSASLEASFGSSPRQTAVDDPRLARWYGCSRRHSKRAATLNHCAPRAPLPPTLRQLLFLD